jgi:predicted DNA-binding transcriptional regulator YafY
MLVALQSRKYTTAEYLAERFEISIRTVYRDIKALGEIGIPVSFENNKGYFIMQGYFLPPVSFTTDEANALILMDAIAHRFTDQSIEKNYKTALDKIKAVLKGSHKDKLDSLGSQIMTFKPPTLQNNFDHLSHIQNAIANRWMLKVDYMNNQQVKSSRELEPIGLIFYSMNWHLIAWCWLRNEYRDFRLSNIQHLTTTQICFRKTDHIELNDYLKMYAS